MIYLPLPALQYTERVCRLRGLCLHTLTHMHIVTEGTHTTPASVSHLFSLADFLSFLCIVPRCWLLMVLKSTLLMHRERGGGEERREGRGEGGGEERGERKWGEY